MTEHVHDQHAEPLDPKPALDEVARRTTLYVGAILSVITLAAIVTTATVRAVTNDVNIELAKTRAEVAATRNEVRVRAAADSARFERVMSVVELAVVALVEPAGSEDQKAAVVELRRRRQVTRY
jgi:hypothetical protein